MSISVTDVTQMWGTLRDAPSSNWSERAYQHFLPPVTELPPEASRLWERIRQGRG